MTGEEEKVLRHYVVDVQKGLTTYTEFEEWIELMRDGSDDGDQEYKAVLAEAKAYERGLKDGEARAKKYAR